MKELKRLLLIIDNFVPAEVKSRLYSSGKTHFMIRSVFVHFCHFSSSLDTLPPVKFVDSNPWLSESTHELELLDFTFLSARYDEEQEEWTLCTNLINENQSVRRPVAIVGRRRPMSDHALQQIKHKSKEAIRYKGENLLNYELDMPLRTTYEYKNPKVSASLQAVLQEAMQTEDDIDITDVSP